MTRVRTAVDRVDSVFLKNENRGYADEYLKALMESWRIAKSSTSKTMVLFLALALVHELLVHAAVERASIGPFEVKDLTLVRMIMPVIMSYLFFEISVLIYRTTDCERASGRLMRILHKDVVDEGLGAFISPPAAAFFDVMPITNKRGSFLQFVRLSVVLLIYLGMLGFGLYAGYSVLLEASGSRLLRLAAGTFSFFLLLGGIAVMAGRDRSDVHEAIFRE